MATPPVSTTLAVFGDSAASGASLKAYSGTVSIGLCGLPLSYSTTAPRRKPGPVGKYFTFTTQLVLEIPVVQVVPLATVKSSPCAPNVSACTVPSVVEPIVNGSVSVFPLEVPIDKWPKPTAAAATVTARLLLVSLAYNLPKASTATPCGPLSVNELVTTADPAPLDVTCTMRLLPASAMKIFPEPSTATPRGSFKAVPSPEMLNTEPAVPPAATTTTRLFPLSAMYRFPAASVVNPMGVSSGVPSAVIFKTAAVPPAGTS